MTSILMKGGDDARPQLGVVVLGPPGAWTDRLTAELSVAGDPSPVRRLDAVIYSPWVQGSRPDLDQAARDFERGRQVRALQWIVISSAAAHSPSYRHTGYTAEVRPRTGNVIAESWQAYEDLARRIVGKTTRLTMLRPTTVLIPDPAAGALASLFTGSWALTVAGFDPSLQLLSSNDLIAAVRRALEQGARGVYQVAPAAAIPLHKALRQAGVRRLPVPSPLARLLGSHERLAYLRDSWTVSDQKIRRKLGFKPRHSSAEALAAICDPAGGFARRRGAEARSPAGLDHDPFGQDREKIVAWSKTWLRWLHDRYWRVEWRGLERVPVRGRAVLAGVHRGFQPWDGVMTLHLIARQLGRFPRFLIHPALVKPPFLAPFMTRLGGLPACRRNADWVLAHDGLLGIYPEGVQGAFVRYRDAYRLGRFGRDEFIKMALRNRAPIVPFVTLGSAETFPILAKVRWPWWQRLSGWPCFPVTPTMGLLPLPSKWHTWFLEPLEVHRDHPPEAAEDPQVVRALSQEVRRRMEQALAEMLDRRRSIFYGSIFQRSEPVETQQESA